MSTDWRQRGACRDEDPELMYPVGISGPALAQIAQAKTVCGRCPVSAVCLEHALGARIEAGVWGGKTEDERRSIIRKRDRERVRTGAETTSPPAISRVRGEVDQSQTIENLLRGGLLPHQIAMRLGVSERVVRGHLGESPARRAS